MVRYRGSRKVERGEGERGKQGGREAERVEEGGGEK